MVRIGICDDEKQIVQILKEKIKFRRRKNYEEQIINKRNI